MDYIETTIGKLAKYSQFINEWSEKVLDDTVENDELLKIFNRCKKAIEIIGQHFYPTNKKKIYLENILNEIYSSLRQINNALKDYEKDSIFLKDIRLVDLQKCLKRTNYLIQEIYNYMKKYDEENEGKIPNNFNPPKITHNKSVFLLSIKILNSIPMSPENIFVNMVQYKDMVYYVETNDIFSFFYFYRTEECWFWSPPKKTDPEDIWIECPNIKIEEGYWAGKIIPPFMEEYIKWLHLFFPNIPEYYRKKKDEKKEKKNSKKAKDDQKNGKCTIF